MKENTKPTPRPSKPGSKQYQKTSNLTPAKKKFAQVYATTDNATQAILEAFPEIKDRRVAAVKGHRLLRNDNVKKQIEWQKGKLEQLATEAVSRVGELVHSPNEKIATTNAWKIIEQVHGKSVQKTENTSKTVEVKLDLSGVRIGSHYLSSAVPVQGIEQ